MSGFYHKSAMASCMLSLDFRKAGLREDERVLTALDWEVFPDCDVKLCPKVSTQPDILTAEITGGQIGQTYFVTANVQTDQNRKLQRCVVLRISNDEEFHK